MDTHCIRLAGICPLTVCDHVRLQERALQQHVVVAQRLVNGRNHTLCGSLTLLDAVGAISQNLGLHNGHQPVFLADLGVASQAVRVLMNGLHTMTGMSQCSAVQTACGAVRRCSQVFVGCVGPESGHCTPSSALQSNDSGLSASLAN